MKTKARHEGFLLIDNRHAPGLSVEQIAATGLDPAKVAGAGVRGVYESATVTCPHCLAVVYLNPDRQRSRGYCRGCDHYICDNCSLRMKLGASCRAGFLDRLKERREREEQRQQRGI